MPLVDKLKLSSEDVKALLHDISVDSSIGILDEEDKAYIFIEEEMVKLGGLQSASIEWTQVEEKAKHLLTEKFKHLHVVRYLMQCWFREKSWEAHRRSCEFLTGFLCLYFENSYPKSGKNGLIAKRRLLGTILDNTKDAFDGLNSQEQGKDFFEQHAITLEELKKSLEEAGLKKEAMTSIDVMKNKLKSYMTQTPPTTNQPQAPHDQKGGKVLGVDYFSSPKVDVASITDDREARKTLLNVAELINQRDAYDSTGYMLRRYALWGWLTTSPIVVDGKRTELRAVPVEVSSLYEEALNSNAVSPGLLEKIERSVVSSVYWFKGSYYAYEVATRLEMNEVALAIHNATTRFVRRLPVLMELQFNDKQPFMDEVTLKWIQKSPDDEQKAEARLDVGADYKRLKKELMDLMEKKGIEAVLLQLEKKNSQKQSMRRQCQTIKIAADLLSERGLKWFADELYQKVEKQMLETLAAYWEPELFREITKNRTETSQTVNDK
ncbi:MAG: type VI secretion system protein TssA [Saezia sp.]